MTVNVYKLPQPYMELSLVAGGTLDVGQEYFFIQYFNNGQGYYGNAVGQASVQKSITPTVGNQSIKIDWWVYNKDITAFAVADPTHTTVTSEAHGKANGDSVHIGETTNYNGDYIISNITADTFDIEKVFAGTETGIVAWDKGLPNFSMRYQGAIWKWDKYSMLRPDGSYYQWFNLNDPAVNSFTGGDEYFYSYTKRYGHRKWTDRYYHNGYSAGDSITFTKEETSAGYNLLMDGDVLGTAVTGSMRHPQIAYNSRRYATPYSTGQFNIEKGRLLIVSDSDNATTDDLLNALKASGHYDMFLITNTYVDRSAMKGLVLAGFFQQPAPGGFYFKDLNITLIGGQFDNNQRSTYQGFKFERCVAVTMGMQQYSWNTERATYIDSVRNHIGNAYIMDYVDSVNSSFQGGISFYKKTPSGYNFIGGFAGAQPYFQWRYQRKVDMESIMQDMYINNYYMYFTQDWSGNNTGIMERVKFDNDGVQDYDVHVYWGYVDGDCNYTMECVGVTSNRPNGQLIIHSYNPTAHTVADVWNFRYKISLAVIDENGDPIEDVNCELSWGAGSDTSITDSNGLTDVKGLGYTIESQQSSGASYYANSNWNKMELTISKAGYTTLIFKELDIKEDKD